MRREIIDNITHNAQLKTYPDGGGVLYVADRKIFREPGWEAAVDMARRPDQKADRRKASGEDIERAKRRARAKVSDYARCNDFKYFVTLTLDSTKVDRYDLSAVLRNLRVYLDNSVRRAGLVYVLVPELHKDGAIHFHGLINDALRVADSGTIKLDQGRKPRKPRSHRQRSEWLASGGHVVYNLPDYKLGFSTAIELYGDYSKAVSYVCKYIGKGGKVGGRWYYSGGGLAGPEKKYLDLDYSEFYDSNHSFTIKRLNSQVVRKEIDTNDE